MKIWLTKNLRFGYKYSSNKTMRSRINSCLSDWLDDLLNKKSQNDDVVFIVGGLFSNTNPSLIAINDAKNFIKKITNKLNVYLVNTESDIRKFDNEYYSVNDIFSDINNLHIINKIEDLDYCTIIPTGYNLIDCEPSDLYLDSNENKLGDIDIPNIMQLTEDENAPGIIVYDIKTKKHVFVKNNYSPKHIDIKLNNIDDIIKLKEQNKNNFLHLKIDNKLLEEKRIELDILFQKLNINSIKVLDNNEENANFVKGDIDIKNVISDHIGEDEILKKQFERVLNVFDK
jgi:hypothetical protein